MISLASVLIGVDIEDRGGGGDPLPSPALMVPKTIPFLRGLTLGKKVHVCERDTNCICSFRLHFLNEWTER